MATNLITNGDFTTGAAGWLRSPGVVWSGFALNINSNTPEAFEQLLTLTPGDTYYLRYTVFSYGGGTITPYLYDTPGIARTSNGIFTEPIIAGSGSTYAALRFEMTGNIKLYVDAISLYELAVASTAFVPTPDYIEVAPVTAFPLYDGDTIAWSKNRKRWVTRFSFAPECYGSLRNEIMSFKDGELWLHGVNPLRNNFYGVQYTSRITFPTNKIPTKVKAFIAMKESSDDVWGVPSITINDGAPFPIGMTSTLPAAKFALIEGNYYSEFLRDSSTPGVPDPLLNGRPLRGEAMNITIENTNVNPITLFTINVVYIYSEKS